MDLDKKDKVEVVILPEDSYYRLEQDKLQLKIKDDRKEISAVTIENGSKWVADGKAVGSDAHRVLLQIGENELEPAPEGSLSFLDAAGNKLDAPPSEPGEFTLRVSLDQDEYRYDAGDVEAAFEIVAPKLDIALDGDKYTFTAGDPVELKGTVSATLPKGVNGWPSLSVNGEAYEPNSLNWGDKQVDGLTIKIPFTLPPKAFGAEGEYPIRVEFGDISAEETLHITQRPMPEVTFDGEGWTVDDGVYSYVYDGKAADDEDHTLSWHVVPEEEGQANDGKIRPVITRKDSDDPLELADIVDAGEYKITATLTGNKMEVEKPFAIRPRPLNDEMKSQDEQNGLTLTFNGQALSPEADYEVVRAVGYDGKSLRVVLEGKGNFDGEVNADLYCPATVDYEGLKKGSEPVEVGPDGSLTVKGTISLEKAAGLITDKQIKVIAKTAGVETVIDATGKDGAFRFSGDVEVTDGAVVTLTPVINFDGAEPASLAEPVSLAEPFELTIRVFDRKHVMLFGALGAAALIGTIAMLAISLRLRRKMQVERLKLLELQENIWKSQRTISNSRIDKRDE